MKRHYVRDFLLAVGAMPMTPHRYRAKLFRRTGIVIGSDVVIYGGAHFIGDSHIYIGDNVFVNSQCFFDSTAPITVSSGVRIADHVRLITSTHLLGPADQRAGKLTSSPISVGKGVWIGSCAVVLPGVSIADGCVIGAGAVVTNSTEPNGLYVGVPARRIKDLS